MSMIFKQIKKALNKQEKKQCEEQKKFNEIQNKLNFTTIYNKNEDYKTQEKQETIEYSQQRYQKFKQILDQKIIDYDRLQQLTWDGVPLQLRGKVWRVLLKYLPTNKDTQEKTISRKRKDYADMVNIYFNINEQNDRDKHEQKGLDQVICDAERTLPYSKLFREKQIKEMLTRVLFIWNVRHPASGYVQGINDIVTSFIIVFLNEYCEVNLDTLDIPENFNQLTQEQLDEIEADSYWCLSKILDGMLDNYTNNFPGVKKQYSKVQEILKVLDNDLLQHLSTEIEFYELVFKWLICLLLRQFSPKLGLRLFDTYISDDASISTFGVYLFIAIILKWSVKLKKMKFEEIIMFLQKIPTTEWTENDLKLTIAEAYQYQALFETNQKIV